jgi:hypothetical protein
MQKLLDDLHKDMKLQIQGLVPTGQQLYRNVLFDQLYASIPKDPEAKVQPLFQLRPSMQARRVLNSDRCVMARRDGGLGPRDLGLARWWNPATSASFNHRCLQSVTPSASYLGGA